MQYILSYCWGDDPITTMVGDEFEILDKYREFEPAGVGFSSIDELVEFANAVDYDEARISISDKVRFTLSTLDGTPLVIW